MECKIRRKWTYLWARLRQREQMCGYQREEDGGRMECEFGVSRGKLLYGDWMNSEVLLESTGNQIQYPVISHSGKEYEKECVCVYIYFAATKTKLQHCNSTRCICAQLYLTLCSPTDCSPLGSSVHGFSRQEYWSGLPFPTPRIVPTQGLNLCPLHC